MVCKPGLSIPAATGLAPPPNRAPKSPMRTPPMPGAPRFLLTNAKPTPKWGVGQRFPKGLGSPISWFTMSISPCVRGASINPARLVRPLFAARIANRPFQAGPNPRPSTNSHGHLRVPPPTPNVLPLIRCFAPIHVAMKSSAPNFTVAEASSADPRFITATPQLLRPKPDGLSPEGSHLYLDPPTPHSNKSYRPR